MRLYGELADWFHLLTAPEDYAEEAQFYFGVFEELIGHVPQSCLELGSGGGNNASHYAKWVPEVVLSDRSEEMLAISRAIHPKVEHVLGDMRDLRLGRQFEAVFAHDACAYLTTEEDVRRVVETAFAHCAPGGAAIFCPDATAETLVFETDHGGHDGEGRGLRYLEWATPGEPGTYEYVIEYAYLLREDGKPTRVEYDRHVNGALPRAVWMKALGDAGFEPGMRPLVHSEVPEGSYDVFTGRR
ncbi:MAG: trans-aconitate 2-methyltransferase [Dehalococcoidia bacterium]